MCQGEPTSPQERSGTLSPVVFRIDSKPPKMDDCLLDDFDFCSVLSMFACMCRTAPYLSTCFQDEWQIMCATFPALYYMFWTLA